MGALVLYLLVLGTSFVAGRWVVPRWLVASSALGALGVPVALSLGRPALTPQFATSYLVFVGLPLAAGAYLRQHRRLLAVLTARNDELAGQERLRERLRIARDMHDSLGHRLGLASMRAAAIEVSDAPAAHRAAVAELAGYVREAASELHDVVGALREGPGLDAVEALIAEHRRAGADVTLTSRGTPSALDRGAELAAYRVLEEGLTNAGKHAPGRPVRVTLDWEADTLLVSLENPAPADAGPGAAAGPGPGHGLAGLAERVTQAGGLLTSRREPGAFRLSAMLPAATAPGRASGDGVWSGRSVGLGALTAVILFGVLPVAMLLGGG
ncbi:sensor histidine kinase [Cryptosporangium phraense]|uniref:histidine kinase n=1 Tax=Cryptosporangium phraense TaxID=2593070 RepID=A0A545B0N6_9ACTN|nr:histidine kinase [Cryptosporangium phraense]TQS46385.1 hypothetical protein FL583_03045 [Cryptosporangium phraense]